MIALAPWSIMPLMSVFSCCTFDCAFVVSSLMPRLAASSFCDLVDWMRKGLASFSDWAQPIVAVFGSNFAIPRLEALQMGPYCASTPFGNGPGSTLVPPSALTAAGTSPPPAPAEGAAPVVAGAAPVVAGAAAVVAAALDVGAGAAPGEEDLLLQPVATSARPASAAMAARGADIPYLPFHSGTWGQRHGDEPRRVRADGRRTRS